MWKVEGSFYARRGFWQPFTKECDAASDAAAREWILSEVGSCHHVKRNQVRITQVTAVAGA